MDNTKRFVAVVLAADRTGHDPITQHTGATCKAIAPVAGRPMIMRVLDALETSNLVKSIILCGPPEHTLPDCPELEQCIADGRVTWLANLDSPSKSTMKGFEQVDADIPVLLTTADHALLTPQIVQHFLSESLKSKGDATVGLVNIDDITTAFPGAKRTVTKFRDGGYCGCNLFTFNHQGREIVSIWRQAEAMRKRPWRLIARILGPWTVLKYLLGRLTLEQAFNAVSVKTGIHAQAIILPFPEAGIDVDKVEDILLAESILTNNENKRA